MPYATPPARSPSPSLKKDAVFELFGPVPLSRLLDALDPVMDDILWAIEDALGEETFERVKASPRPCRDLVFTLRKRKDDAALAEAFRGVALQLKGLRHLLTPVARVQVADDSSDLERDLEDDSEPVRPGSPFSAAPRAKAPSLASIGFQELKSADALRREISHVERGNSVSVILFSNEKASPTSAKFQADLHKLTKEFPAVKFLHADCEQFEMGLLARSLDIRCPTTLTFVKDGHRRTRGEDAAEIKDDIENALADLRRSKSTPAAAKADKRYPRPPPEWSEQKALTFWRMLPKTVQGIRFAARMRREVRPLLLHTLPHVRARDPEACDTLQRSVRGVCGHYNAQGETIHTCMTCNDNWPVDYCARCFEASQHKGHKVIKRAAPNDRCYCDCGTMAGGKPVGAQCQKHKQEGDIGDVGDRPSDMGDMLAEFLAHSLAGDSH